MNSKLLRNFSFGLIVIGYIYYIYRYIIADVPLMRPGHMK